MKHSLHLAIAGMFCALVVGALYSLSARSLHAAESSFLIGCGSADITGPPAGFPMAGFVKKDRLTEGIHLRQRARAFLVVDPLGEQRVVFVCVELSKITAGIQFEVVSRLQKRFGDLYSTKNVILSATHTHSGAGGYWRYGADGPLGTGYFPEHVAAIADGIESAIATAHQQLQPGRILVARGDVRDASAQRSSVAYRNNPKSERALYSDEIDTEMTLLKFVGGKSGEEELGTVNWFAVHPTSMTYNNHLISGDSKGYASLRFERKKGATYRATNEFVAAFAQTNCGDVTGNLNLNNTGPGKDDFASTRIIGKRQMDAAWQLYNAATEELAGPLDVRHSAVDFSQLTVADQFTGAGTQTTSAATYGYAFAAGSTEDGGGHPMFQEGMKDRNLAIDVLSVQMFPNYQPDDRLRQLQWPKAILFSPGVPNSNSGVPQVLPLSICRIGQLALVVGPAEFTTMSGRRIRRTVKSVFGDAIKYVVIAGYSNDYGGYVSTREEYEMQQYEGGHTLYGPWTLAGYQQEYARLAQAMVDGVPVDPGPLPNHHLQEVQHRSVRLGTDAQPSGARFGDVATPPLTQYTAGDQVEVAFWTGHPRNSFPRPGSYLSIQRQTDDQWTTVATDADWETVCRWQPSRDAALPCQIVITWDIPEHVEPGVFRIVHHGQKRVATDDASQRFDGISNAFRIDR